MTPARYFPYVRTIFLLYHPLSVCIGMHRFVWSEFFSPQKIHNLQWLAKPTVVSYFTSQCKHAQECTDAYEQKSPTCTLEHRFTPSKLDNQVDLRSPLFFSCWTTNVARRRNAPVCIIKSLLGTLFYTFKVTQFAVIWEAHCFFFLLDHPM